MEKQIMLKLPNMIIVFTVFLLGVVILLNLGMSVDLQVDKITQCWKEGKSYNVEFYISKSVKDITCVEIPSGD